MIDDETSQKDFERRNITSIILGNNLIGMTLYDG